MNSDFKNKMIYLSNKINVELQECDIEKFYNYMKLLLEWNEKINLTAITEMNDVILKHFIDSITVLKYLNPDERIIGDERTDGEERIVRSERIVDVGTGAGFPGIPLAILKPNCEITLLDSLNKRILFLQDVIEKVDLKNAITVHYRAEDFGQNKENREKYDISISRAVANLATLVEYMIPLVKIGGRCICMKGANTDEEIENAKFAIKQLGGKIIKVEKLNLPDSDMERTIIIIEKVEETPAKYPRKAGMPSKNPLIK